MTRAALLLAALSASAPCLARGQTLQFRQLTPNSGLSSSQIQTMVQDPRGFMWFGTRKGLNRYDGITFTVYHHRMSDSASIADSRVDASWKDSKGTLWFGTAVGLSRYDPARDAFTNFELTHGEGTLVNAIAEAQGTLWVGTERGLYRFDRTSQKATPYRPDLFAGLDVMSIYEDSSRHLWIGTRNGGARELNEHGALVRDWTTGPSALPGKDVRAFLDDGKGVLWIGMLDGGLARLERATGKLTLFQHSASDSRSLSINAVHVLLADGERGMWVGTENGGLDHFDFVTHRFEHNRFDPASPSGLSSNSIWSILHDDSGLLWIGTFAGGVNIARQNGAAIRQYRSMAGVTTSLSFNSVMGFWEDANRRMWVATDGGGLNLFNPASEKFVRYTTQTSNLNSDAVLAVTEDKAGAVWIATWNGGISRFDAPTGRFTPYTTANSGLAEDRAFSIHVDRSGQIWIGTYTKGLQRLDPASGTFTSYRVAEGEGSQIRIITEMSDGTLLLGTPLRGLAAFNPKTGKAQWYRAGPAGISSNQVQAILEAEPGVAWVGTGTGLDRIDFRTGTIQRFTEADGLPAGGVAGIELDASHMLWLSGDRGITRFDPVAKTGKTYTVSDGLQGNEFNAGASFRTRDGILYFGGSAGFNHLDPSRIAKNSHVPLVAFTAFQLFNTPVAIGAKGSPLTSSITVTKDLVLRHDQSTFTLEFASLDFTAPNKNEYAYKLEGLDEKWNEVGTKHSASYTNLPAAHYVFRVKASNNDGVWNTNGASLSITVLPPAWATWWFRTLVGMVLLAILAAIIRSAQQRHRALRAMNAQLGRASEHDRRSQQYLEGNVLDILGAMQRFSTGDYSVALDVHSDDAIGKLRSGFNSVVADRKRAEEELRQSQKMEAVGRLAGGVAHDFNNLLTVIKGNAELALDDVGMKDGVRQELEEIGRAADRATSLTRQLLAFSRKQILKPQTFSMNEMVAEVGRMLRRTVGEDIELRIVLDPSAGVVCADPGQIEQVLLNLVVNARDAMPRGGALIIETKSVDAAALRDMAEADNIPYVAIIVTDTGTGMAPEVLERVFEPFYTTKERGKGTGLGLSTVYGSVKQSGGFVRAESAMDKGSTFSVYLPRAKEVGYERPREIEAGPRGSATVLLAEDEDAVRRLASRVLARSGYTVLTAASGAEALAVAAAYEGTIDLLLTDVVMPGMSGRELAEQLIPRRPGMLLLYASGYTEDAIIRHGVSSHETAFLQKPFTPAALLHKVRQVLEGTRSHLETMLAAS
ncbi:MAG: two-component regulator propeller domain-containing protein [bacterium]